MSDVMESLTAIIEYAEATKRFADAGSLKRVATEIEILRAKVAELEAGGEPFLYYLEQGGGNYTVSKIKQAVSPLHWEPLYTTPQPVKVPEDLVAWKCEILDEIASDIYRRRYGSQAETAKILGITQPRVSAIANRRYEDFSLEAALTYKAMLSAQNN